LQYCKDDIDKKKNSPLGVGLSNDKTGQYKDNKLMKYQSEDGRNSVKDFGSYSQPSPPPTIESYLLALSYKDCSATTANSLHSRGASTAAILVTIVCRHGRCCLPEQSHHRQNNKMAAT
jgi:hypothetical protein